MPTKKRNTRPAPPGLVVRSHAELEALAARLGVPPITDLAQLAGDFWPEEETTEEFLETLYRWRHEGTKRAAP